MDVIDRAGLQVSGILAPAQGRRDARHHRRRNAPDPPGGAAVDMAANDGHHPRRMLHRLAQPLHHFSGFKVDALRSHRNLERRMMREYRDGLRWLGIDHGDQALRAFGTKIALVAVCIERIDRNQPDRIVLDGVVDKTGIGIEISLGDKGRS